MVGVPDPIRDEAVKAFVVRRPGASWSRGRSGRTAPSASRHFKVPTIVELRDELPLTSIGKVEKKALRALSGVVDVHARLLDARGHLAAARSAVPGRPPRLRALRDRGRGRGPGGRRRRRMFAHLASSSGAPGRRSAELREDGTGVAHDDSLPLEGLRLMGGGQELELGDDLVHGTEFIARPTLEGATLREGRSGALLLIDERDRVPCRRRRAAAHLPRDAARPGSRRDGRSETIGPLVRTPDRLQLFAFSAATWNTHRIHSDPGYAASEGYPDVLVQSHLHAAFIMRALRDAVVPGAGASRFGWQNRTSPSPATADLRRGVKVDARPGASVTYELQERNARRASSASPPSRR